MRVEIRHKKGKMRKLILFCLFLLIFISCSKKGRTYEELEAEVLCNVLPEIINESVSFTLPPPPFPHRYNDSIGSYQKSNSLKSQYEIIQFINKKKDSIKSLAHSDKKLKVSIINDLYELEKSDIKLSKELFRLNKIKNREIKIHELKESTLSFEVVDWESVSSNYYFEKNLTLININYDRFIFVFISYCNCIQSFSTEKN